MDLMLFTTFGNMLILDSVFFPIADTLSGLGFLLVLWSRLHLIMDRPRVLLGLLVFILIIAIPLRIIIILSAIGKNHRPRWGVEPWQVLRRVEMIVPGTEMALAALYIYLFIKRFGWGRSGGKKSLRRVTWSLVAGELFVIAGDATVVAVWFSGYVLLRWALAPFLYALKLQVEFLILNTLTRLGKESAELRTISVLVPDEEAAAATEVLGGAEIMDEQSKALEGKGGVHRGEIKTLMGPEQPLVANSSATRRPSSLSTVSSLERAEHAYPGR
jgi:hypothetical protein